MELKDFYTTVAKSEENLVFFFFFFKPRGLLDIDTAEETLSCHECGVETFNAWKRCRGCDFRPVRKNRKRACQPTTR